MITGHILASEVLIHTAISEKLSHTMNSSATLKMTVMCMLQFSVQKIIARSMCFNSNTFPKFYDFLQLFLLQYMHNLYNSMYGTLFTK